MKGNHTPGPWHAQTESTPIYVRNAAGMAVCKPLANTEMPYEVYRANGALIAAAPAMLELLRAANLWLSNVPTEEQLDLAAGSEPDQRRSGRRLFGQIRETIKAATE